MAGEAEKMMWMSDVMTSGIKQRGGQIGGRAGGGTDMEQELQNNAICEKGHLIRLVLFRSCTTFSSPLIYTLMHSGEY